MRFALVLSLCVPALTVFAAPERNAKGEAYLQAPRAPAGDGLIEVCNPGRAMIIDVKRHGTNSCTAPWNGIHNLMQVIELLC
jgi:hypothetical protein